MSPDENRGFPEWNPLQRTWPRISLKLRKDAFDHLPFEVDWDGVIYVDLPAELYLELFDVFERKYKTTHGFIRALKRRFRSVVEKGELVDVVSLDSFSYDNSVEVSVVVDFSKLNKLLERRIRAQIDKPQDFENWAREHIEKLLTVVPFPIRLDLYPLSDFVKTLRITGDYLELIQIQTKISAITKFLADEIEDIISMFKKEDVIEFVFLVQDLEHVSSMVADIPPYLIMPFAAALRSLLERFCDTWLLYFFAFCMVLDDNCRDVSPQTYNLALKLSNIYQLSRTEWEELIGHVLTELRKYIVKSRKGISRGVAVCSFNDLVNAFRKGTYNEQETPASMNFQTINICASILEAAGDTNAAMRLKAYWSILSRIVHGSLPVQRFWSVAEVKAWKFFLRLFVSDLVVLTRKVLEVPSYLQ